MKWRKWSGQALDAPLIKAVEATILREKANGHRLKVCIGTDSQVHNGHVNIASVIVFVREKKGAFMYVSKTSTDRQMSLKERMIAEVARSVEIAYSLCDLLDKHNVELEVHADINTDPEFKSNSALKQAMGYILGMGFVFKAKPEAYASSSAADKMC